jgi:hypothetical protein
MIYFSLLSMRLSRSHDWGREFGMLTQLTRVFSSFLIGSFLILSFNMKLIMN